MEDLKKAVELLKKHEVRWVHSTFVDIRGLMQDVVIPAKQYIEGSPFSAGIGFDGSSIRGFKEIHESDMILKPDPKTLVTPKEEQHYCHVHVLAQSRKGVREKRWRI